MKRLSVPVWLCNTPGFWGHKFLDASTHGKVTEPFPYPPSTSGTVYLAVPGVSGCGFCAGSEIQVVLGEGGPLELVSLSYKHTHQEFIVL